MKSGMENWRASAFPAGRTCFGAALPGRDGNMGKSGQMADGGGKRWAGSRVYVGKGGKVVGKRTGFAHLFPHDSTQVVDFPRMYDVRVFLGGAMKFSFQSQAELGTEMGAQWSCSLARNVVALLRVRAIFCGGINP